MTPTEEMLDKIFDEVVTAMMKIDRGDREGFYKAIDNASELIQELKQEEKIKTLNP